MPDIVILTAGDSMRAEYVKSLINTINFMNNEGISHKWGNSQGSLIGYVRNILWQEARQIECKKIVWIDSDISWEVNDFVALTASDKDIISGMYLNVKNEVVGQTVQGRKEHLNQEIVEMDWLGLGFLCVSREVALALPEPFMRHKTYGEDVSFCLNAKEAGFRCWIDPTIRVTHHKVLPITP